MFASLLKLSRNLGFARAHVQSIRLFSDGQTTWWNMTRYHLDPEYRRRVLEWIVQYRKLRKARDPIYRKKYLALDKAFMRQKRSGEAYFKSETLTNWVRLSRWHTADLSWKSYQPELSPERVIRPCSGCNRADFRAKLWWSSVVSEKYLCGQCWWKLSWEDKCPRGFEDAATYKEFSARAKELGVNKSSGPRS